MKKFIKNSGMKLLFLSLIGQCVYANRGPEVQYGTLVSIGDARNQNNLVWTYGDSRDPGNNTGPVGDHNEHKSKTRRVVSAPDNHHELLVREKNVDKKRDRSGPQLYIIKSAVDENKTGPVSYGEVIKFISIASGAGIAAESGFQDNGRIFWVHNPGRWGNEHGELFVSVPDYSETKTDAAHFKITGLLKGNGTVEERTGFVYQNDVIGIESIKISGARWWFGGGSRFGDGFGEIHVSADDKWGKQPAHGGEDRRIANGKFRIKNITDDKINDAGRGIAKQALTKGFLFNAAAYQAGETEYIHDRAFNKRFQVVFAENWKFPAMSGKKWMKFKARGLFDLNVVFSTVAHSYFSMEEKAASGFDYRFIVGGAGNKQMIIRKSNSNRYDQVFESHTNRGGNANAIVTGGVPGDGTTFDNYWFAFENGKLSWGKGETVGENEIVSWTDPNPGEHAAVSYVGLGGGVSNRLEFSNITFGVTEASSASGVAPTPVVVPEVTPTPVVAPEVTPTPVVAPEVAPTPAVALETVVAEVKMAGVDPVVAEKGVADAEKARQDALREGKPEEVAQKAAEQAAVQAGVPVEQAEKVAATVIEEAKPAQVAAEAGVAPEVATQAAAVADTAHDGALDAGKTSQEAEKAAQDAVIAVGIPIEVAKEVAEAVAAKVTPAEQKYLSPQEQEEAATARAETKALDKEIKKAKKSGDKKEVKALKKKRGEKRKTLKKLKRKAKKGKKKDKKETKKETKKGKKKDKKETKKETKKGKKKGKKKAKKRKKSKKAKVETAQGAEQVEAVK